MKSIYLFLSSYVVWDYNMRLQIPSKARQIYLYARLISLSLNWRVSRRLSMWISQHAFNNADQWSTGQYILFHLIEKSLEIEYNNVKTAAISGAKRDLGWMIASSSTLRVCLGVERSDLHFVRQRNQYQGIWISLSEFHSRIGKSSIYCYINITLIVLLRKVH